MTYIMDRLVDVEARYERAVKNGDKKELSYFWQFGTEYRRITENAATYEQYLSLGYTDAPRINDVGWLTNGSHKELKDRFEVIQVFVHGHHECRIMLLRFPNGRWSNGQRLEVAGAYSYSSPSIWGNTYATRQDALNAAIDLCVECIENSITHSDKKYLVPVQQLRMSIMQQDLFG